MAGYQISKVVGALPAVLEADTIYLVKRATGFDFYVTNHTGTIVSYSLNGSQIDIFGGPGLVQGTDFGPMTWTKPAGCRFVMVCCIGSGAAGGSGRKGAVGSVRVGGSGGGSAGLSILNLAADSLAATVGLWVGEAFIGPAGVTTDSTNGVTGNFGAASSFGTYLRSINNPSGGVGGGTANGSNASAGTGTATGATGGAASASGVGGSGNQAGGLAAGSGAAGGTITAAEVLFRGGTGGLFGAAINSATAAPLAGTAVAPNGLIGPAAPTGHSYGAMGGSGGYPSKTAGVAAGDGGQGGWPGGGGGGGGAGTDGLSNSGAGARGGNGVVIVMSIM